MRISRKRRPQKALIPDYRKNLQIKVAEVRLLNALGENLGVVPLEEALRKAEAEEMDLVEINPKAEPPVVKIVEFTQFKYQKEKEARKMKAKAHIAELKGIRLSIRISDHDLGVRQAQAEKFLNRGDKTKIEIILRGRERGRADIGVEIIRRFVSQIEKNMPIRYEQEIARQGPKVTAIITKK